MKLCVFQGTFNPIHNAHLRVCEYAKQIYNFDKIILIPAYKPPHKNIDSALSFHRLNMVQLAFESFEYTEVSNIEYKRESPSYTYHTIQELYKIYKPEEKIDFLIGTDAFKNIETWFETDKLKQLVNFIVFIREDSKCLQNDINYFDKLKQNGYNYKMMKLPYMDISSTQIRKNIITGNPIKGMVPTNIEKYIKDNDLYKN